MPVQIANSLLYSSLFAMKIIFFFSDVTRLPEISFNHVNKASLTRSWIDHCLASQSIDQAKEKFVIDCDYKGTDHFPLCINNKSLHDFIERWKLGCKIRSTYRYASLRIGKFGCLSQKLSSDAAKICFVCEKGLNQ